MSKFNVDEQVKVATDIYDDYGFLVGAGTIGEIVSTITIGDGYDYLIAFDDEILSLCEDELERA